MLWSPIVVYRSNPIIFIKHSIQTNNFYAMVTNSGVPLKTLNYELQSFSKQQIILLWSPNVDDRSFDLQWPSIVMSAQNLTRF